MWLFLNSQILVNALSLVVIALLGGVQPWVLAVVLVCNFGIGILIFKSVSRLHKKPLWLRLVTPFIFVIGIAQILATLRYIVR